MTLAVHNMTDKEILDIAALSNDPFIRRLGTIVDEFYVHVDEPDDIPQLQDELAEVRSHLALAEDEIQEMTDKLRTWQNEDERYLEIERNLDQSMYREKYLNDLTRRQEREIDQLSEKFKIWSIVGA